MGGQHMRGGGITQLLGPTALTVAAVGAVEVGLTAMEALLSPLWKVVLQATLVERETHKRLSRCGR
jgi:hypothetical protein